MSFYAGTVTFDFSARGNALTDTALGVAVFAVVAAAISVDLGGTRGPDPLAYLIAACLGALMLVRRQYPVLALIATAAGIIAYYMLGYPAIGLAIPVAAALYSAAEAGKPRAAMALAVGLVAVATTFRLLDNADPGYLFGYELPWTAGIMGGAIVLGDNVRSRRLLRRQHQEVLRAEAEEREREAQRRAEQERSRIARDVHDVLGHTIAVISVQADLASETLTEDPAATRAALATIRSTSDDAVRELRGTVGLFRADEHAPREPAGSLRNLDSLAGTISNGTLTVSTHTTGTPVELPAAVDSTAYRIVREALANSVRHAHAQHADVVVRYEPDQLLLSITDNGVGHPGPSGPSNGQGIAGMTERATLLGGEVTVLSSPGEGFRVDAALPIKVSE